MHLTDLRHKKTAVWGMGKEGQAMADFLQKQQIDFLAITPENEQDVLSCEVVFKSPGISLYHPLVSAAKEKGVIITSGTNFYMETKPTGIKTIAVTGTKGKSTTSSLMAHVLKKMGYRVGFGGNIGVPLIQLWDQPMDFLVAELSSYQCSDLSTGFDISIVTNLYPEHVDWHQTHERYYRDKLHLLAVRAPGQKAVLNAKNEKLMQLTDGLKEVVYFNQTVSTIKSPLLGQHNQENIDAVRTALAILGLPTHDLEKNLADFKPLAHRLEVFEIDGVTYVDDSISTTPETAVAALKVFEGKRRFLFVGGYDRQQDYGCLFDYIAGKDITLVCLPDTGRRIYNQMQGGFMAADMKAAVAWVKEQVHSGDVVILSPGAPSYNCYANFEERGLDFKNCVCPQKNS